MIHPFTKQLAAVRVLSDVLKATSVGSLSRAVAWFIEQEITSRWIPSENGPAYRFGEWRKGGGKVLDLNPIRTNPYTPRTKGIAK